MIYILPTPRFVTTFKPAGTRSFRLAASQFMGEYGGNAQNPPPCVSRILTARPGYRFVQPDQSGAEALIVAMLAKPGRYRALFENGVKPHTFLALHLFAAYHSEWFIGLESATRYLAALEPADLVKIPGWSTLKTRIEKAPPPNHPYYIGKRTAHARSYKMGWITFQKSVLRDTEGGLALPAADCKRFLTGFDRLFPEIIELQNEIIELAKTTRELVNLFGFPRRFERTFTHGYEREIISWIFQSTVGCLTTEAILKIEDDVIIPERRAWNVLNNKHDSLLLEVPEADVPEAARISRDVIAGFELTGRDGVKFRMKSEVKVGTNWADWDEKLNPAGMKTFDVRNN